MSEPTDQILSAIAHELTGLVAANCCAKTGGRGGEAGKHCECRETALDVYRAAVPLIEAAVLEKAAKVADKEAATYDALIEQGKGEHGKPGYVRDDTWNSWLGKYSIAMSIASDVRALKPEPSA
jgi:hypothetical protein